MTVKQLQYVTIGDEYAKRLDYEELVGAMAIVDNVLKALVGVTIISGKPDMIGKQVDIHKGDAILVQSDKAPKLYAVADFINGRVYYTENRYFADKASGYIGRNQTQIFSNFEHLHEVLDEVTSKYAFKRAPTDFGFRETVEPMNWLVYSLDDETCIATKSFRDTFNMQMAAEEARAKRTIEVSAEKKAKVSSLTEQLKSQLENQIQAVQSPETHGWNPDDGAADQLDSNYSEGYGDVLDYPDDDSFGDID